MEASLLDLTRGLDRFRGYGAALAFQAVDHEALEVEIEVVSDHDEEDIVIEYVFDHSPIEDALADGWFSAHDDDVQPVTEEPVAASSGRGLQAILCFGIAVLLAACLHASSL
jgi:hypothetical protein